MNSIDFNKCREFLEYQIGNNPDNHELVKAYTKLIESKTEFDMALIYDEASLDWDEFDDEVSDTEDEEK